MTARRMKGSADPERGSLVHRAGKAPSRFPIEHSLYLGRERLGRYVQMRHNRFRAFDALDRPLGNFRIRARVLFAIRKAWRRLA